MSDSFDLRQVLADWPFDPDNDVRVARGDDGREIIQVRTPLGVEQLEMTGRPDGARPHSSESALEFHLKRLEKAKVAGREDDFELTSNDCAELFSEGTLYYFRYLRLFQLRRWKETVRDTSRNLRLFDIIHEYAAAADDREYLEKWRPYILRMNAAASAAMHLDQGSHDKALDVVNNTIQHVEDLDEMDDETFSFERDRSLTALRELEYQIRQTRPMPALERLEQQLQRAIDRQEFERAAELRDRLRELKSRQPAK